MNRILILVALLAVSMLLAGCPKRPTTVDDVAAAEPVGGVAGTTTGAGGVGVGAGRELADDRDLGTDPALAGAGTIILFDFDSSEIRPEFNGVIASTARRLATDGNLRVRLEGHTDERGSPEYNIALGERRAQAVRRALVLQGARDGQLTTVSFGEERPAVDGGGEEAWAQNRRVEIVALGGR